MRRLTTALSVAVLLLPATLASAEAAPPDPNLETFQQVDARRIRLEHELGLLTDRLQLVEGDLARTDRNLATTTRDLNTTFARRTRTERTLEAKRTEFTRRIRERYKRGDTTLGYLVLLDVDELRDLSRTAKYVRAVVQRDHRDIDAFTRLARLFAADEARLAQLQARQAAERDDLLRQREELDRLVARHHVLLAAAQAEARRHQLLLFQLERDPASARWLTAALAEDSRHIAGTLKDRSGGTAARGGSAGAPRGEFPEERAQEAPEVSGSAAQGAGFLWPAAGPVTSVFGPRIHPISGERRFHAGIDIGAPAGSRIRAAGAGVVVGAGPRRGYGNVVVLDHGQGVATLYAHQSRILVDAGQRVARGATIGTVGSTGYATGPHLHFEVRVFGEPRDPRRWL